MRILTHALLASAAFALPATAHATVIASLGGNTTNFASLTSAGLNGGATATLSGGTVYSSDQPFADIPKGGVFGGTFLAAGVLAGEPATLTFTVPTSYLSFLWGSPDTYNTLTFAFADSTTATCNFNDLGGLGTYSPDNALATISTDVAFSSVTFSSGSNAFEYVIQTAAVPVPAAGLLLVGALGGLAGLRRRRKAA